MWRERFKYSYYGKPQRTGEKKTKSRALQPNYIDIKPNYLLNFPTLLAAVFIAAVVLAVFGKVWGFEFVAFDDDVYVTNNLWVQGGISFKSIGWAFSTLYAGFWHPLTLLSLMVDYEIYGLDAAGFHLTNVFFTRRVR